MADGLGRGVRWEQSREAREAAKEVLRTTWGKAGADSGGEEGVQWAGGEVTSHR